MAISERDELNAPPVKSTPPVREMGVGSHRNGIERASTCHRDGTKTASKSHRHGIEMIPRRYQVSNHGIAVFTRILPLFTVFSTFDHVFSHAIFRKCVILMHPKTALLSGSPAGHFCPVSHPDSPTRFFFTRCKWRFSLPMLVGLSPVGRTLSGQLV